MFDDVIEDVLARGVIGDEADGCRVRGTVGVLLFISRCFGICNNFYYYYDIK